MKSKELDRMIDNMLARREIAKRRAVILTKEQWGEACNSLKKSGEGTSFDDIVNHISATMK